MITRVNVTAYDYNATSHKATKDFFIGVKSEFDIKSIEGLTPVQNTISSVSSGVDAGDIYLSSHAESRNIVITIGLDPDTGLGRDVSTLRRELYSLFPFASDLRLIFEDSVLGNLQINGVLESIETVVFSKDQEIQISILCPYPYFEKMGLPIIQNLSGITDIDYVGTAPIGFRWHAKVSSLTAFPEIKQSLQFYSTDYTRVIEYFTWNGNLFVGDIFSVNSKRPNRSITFYRGGVPNLDAIVAFSGSLTTAQLYPGLNRLRSLRNTYNSEDYIEYSIAYNGI